MKFLPLIMSVWFIGLIVIFNKAIARERRFDKPRNTAPWGTVEEMKSALKAWKDA